MENLEINPLVPESVKESLALLNKTFIQFSEEEDPFVWFKVSLDPEKHQELMNQHGVSDVRYFTVKDTKTNKIIGTTGLYHLAKEPSDTVWLGWFCIDEKYRGKGIGKRVLQWTIAKAKKERNTLLKLYTSPGPGLDAAQILYDKFGFKTTRTEEKNGYIVHYRQLNLRARPQIT